MSQGTTVRLAAQALAMAALLSACTTAGGDDDIGKASPIGLVVLVLFFIAGIFLMRSMTKHIKKVPQSFEDTPSEDTPSKEQADRDRSESTNGD